MSRHNVNLLPCLFMAGLLLSVCLHEALAQRTTRDDGPRVYSTQGDRSARSHNEVQERLSPTAERNEAIMERRQNINEESDDKDGRRYPRPGVYDMDQIRDRDHDRDWDWDRWGDRDRRDRRDWWEDRYRRHYNRSNYYYGYNYPWAPVIIYADEDDEASEVIYEVTERGERRWVPGHYEEIVVEEVIEGEFVEVYHPAIYERGENGNLKQLEEERTERLPKVRLIVTQEWVAGHYEYGPEEDE